MAQTMPKSNSEDDYRAKDDARTLQQAEEIHSDGDRLSRAHVHLHHAKNALHRTLKRVKRGLRKSSK